MNRNLYVRLKKLQEKTFHNKVLWCVHVESDDKWTPYSIGWETGKEYQRLQTMTGEEFIEWQEQLGRRALVILDENYTDMDND